jgi:hypothetical protein
VKTTGLRQGRILLLLLFFGSELLLSGCSDNPNQSGTQVHVSEQAKAQPEARRDSKKAESLRIKSQNIKTH